MTSLYQDDNPMESVIDSIMQMFIMTLGAFDDIWQALPDTSHELVGMLEQVHQK